MYCWCLWSGRVCLKALFMNSCFRCWLLLSFNVNSKCGKRVMNFLFKDFSFIVIIFLATFRYFLHKRDLIQFHNINLLYLASYRQILMFIFLYFINNVNNPISFKISYGYTEQNDNIRLYILIMATKKETLNKSFEWWRRSFNVYIFKKLYLHKLKNLDIHSKLKATNWIYWKNIQSKPIKIFSSPCSLLGNDKNTGKSLASYLYHILVSCIIYT